MRSIVSGLSWIASLRETALEWAARGPWTRSRRFARFLDPQPSGRLIRIGTAYGGWTVPDDFAAESVCYCAGVGHDISFDLGLIDHYGCTVDAFDPTPSAAAYAARMAAGEPRFFFHQVGVWSEDVELGFFEPDYGDENYSAVNLHSTKESFTAQCRTVHSLMDELGHDHIDLLKLDIEGAEYEVVDSLHRDPVPIGVLCIEFHKNRPLRGMKAAAAKLRAGGFTPVCAEGYDVTFVHESRRGRPSSQPPR